MRLKNGETPILSQPVFLGKQFDIHVVIVCGVRGLAAVDALPSDVNSHAKQNAAASSRCVLGCGQPKTESNKNRAVQADPRRRRASVAVPTSHLESTEIE